MINQENLLKIGRAGGKILNQETPNQIGRVGISGSASQLTVSVAQTLWSVFDIISNFTKHKKEHLHMKCK